MATLAFNELNAYLQNTCKRLLLYKSLLVDVDIFTDFCALEEQLKMLDSGSL